MQEHRLVFIKYFNTDELHRGFIKIGFSLFGFKIGYLLNFYFLIKLYENNGWKKIIVDYNSIAGSLFCIPQIQTKSVTFKEHCRIKYSK